jgi:hypothetical protein
LKIAKDDDGSSIEINRPQGLKDVSPKSDCFDPHGGRGFRRSRILRVRWLGKRRMPAKPLATEVAVDAVQGHPNRPRTEPRPAVKAREALKHSQKGVLGNVSGDLGIPQHPKADAEYPALVLPKELFEGIWTPFSPRIKKDLILVNVASNAHSNKHTGLTGVRIAAWANAARGGSSRRSCLF